MSKAILVIDMPSCCNECSLMFKDEYSYHCPIKCDENITDLYDNYIMFHRKPDWCPLKQLPNKRNVNDIWTMGGCISDDYSIGWNTCINEILETHKNEVLSGENYEM